MRTRRRIGGTHATYGSPEIEDQAANRETARTSDHAKVAGPEGDHAGQEVAPHRSDVVSVAGHLATSLGVGQSPEIDEHLLVFFRIEVAESPRQQLAGRHAQQLR